MIDRKERFVRAYNYLKMEGLIKTQEDVAQKMKTTRPTISLALNGKESALTDSFIARFCASFPQISYLWLLQGRGEMITDQGKTILERIREILRIEMRSASTIGEEFGGELVNLQDYLDNDEEPNVRTVDELCKALHLNRDWVLRGVGSVKEEEADQDVQHHYSFIAAPQNKQEATRPRIPVSAVTGGLHAYINGEMKGQYVMMPAIKHFSDYDFTMFIRDDTMMPRYERGDEIALKEVAFVKEWGKEYALDTHDGIIFKRIYEEGENIRCVSFNKEYQDIVIPKSAIVGYFRLVGLVRV